MKVKIEPSSISGEITAPPSKSYAHREIILACLAGSECVIKGVGNSDDVKATINCMRSLGANCVCDGCDLIVKGFTRKEEATLDCNESGSTLRFLLPVSAALGAKTRFLGTKKLLSRPSETLIKCLNERGADIDNFCVNGMVNGGKFFIDASVSSQYISGLLIAATLMKNDVEVHLLGKEVSSPYIDITIDVLSSFSIEVEKTSYGYLVKGGQKLLAPKVITVEGDYSGSAFFLAAGALGKGVTVNNLNPSSKQGDKKFLEVLKLVGASIEWNKDSVTVCKGALNAITVDCDDIPDLAQAIAVTTSFAFGESALKGLTRLRYKESDRLKAICDMLSVSGIKCESNGGELLIRGGKPSGGVFDSGNDHRTAMACAILATFASGESVINQAEAVKKSYPNFYDDLIKIGGKVYVDI